MRSSRLGIFAIIALSVFLTTNCTYYNRIMSRKDLVDGSAAYNERKFADAESMFRNAVSRDPEGATLEGRTAQVLLARTLHSIYIGNRKDSAKAEEAIAEYKKALQLDKEDQSSYKAIAGLYENLGQTDNWLKWVTDRANDTSIKPQYRAEALTSLTAKKNTCANEITDTEATKKTVKRDGKDVFEFVKPADPAALERLKGCVADGTKMITEAVQLEPAELATISTADVKTLTDAQLKANSDLIKTFESARSYKASITSQAARLAEMQGNTAERDRLRAEAEALKAKFAELTEVSRKYQAEIEARAAAAKEAENANANQAK